MSLSFQLPISLFIPGSPVVEYGWAVLAVLLGLLLPLGIATAGRKPCCGTRMGCVHGASWSSDSTGDSDCGLLLLLLSLLLLLMLLLLLLLLLSLLAPWALEAGCNALSRQVTGFSRPAGPVTFGAGCLRRQPLEDGSIAFSRWAAPAGLLAR